MSYTLNVTVTEVTNTLSQLVAKKAAGPDILGNKILKSCARILGSSLAYLFNKSLSSGIFPSLWKEANITPIYKKNDKDDIRNYRPVSLISSVGKALERLVYDKLYAYFIQNNALTWKNSGFKKGDSTVNQLIYLINNIYKERDFGNDVCMVFLDQSRAFDRIWHKGLIHKLNSLGVRSDLLSWVQHYLSGRKIRVVIDGHHSSSREISAGVPQGSILGPLFFLVYINDISNAIRCEISLYADDTALYIPFNNCNKLDRIAMVNHDLATLQLWSESWYMKFNAEKTKYMIFSTRNTDVPDLYLGNTSIDRVDTYKHLGVHVSSNLSWKNHIENILCKNQRKLALFWKLNTHFPRFITEKLYTSFILPQLDYACVLYDNCSQSLKSRLDHFQRNAAVACTRAYRNTSTSALYKELGWQSLQTRRDYFKLLYIFKIVKGNSPEYMQKTLPPHTNQRYSLRNFINIPIPLCKSEAHRTSFIPSAIKLWNNLDYDSKSTNSLVSFKQMVRKKLFINERNIAFSKGFGSGWINLARFRMGMSGLNSHLFTCNIVNSPACVRCSSENETIKHYFIECPAHSHHRTTLRRSVSDVLMRAGQQQPELSMNNTRIYLYGHPGLPLETNLEILKLSSKFISETKRFM